MNLTLGDMTKETGIIMSGRHPRLVLELIKTMTRRVIKPQPKSYMGKNIYREDIILWGWQIEKEGGFGGCPEYLVGQWIENSGLCPYGQVGDRLWVREVWAVNPTMDDLPPRDISSEAFVYYKAAAVGSPLLIGRWRSSLFMPKKFTRIWLEITGLRAERLRDASPADAIAEGFKTVEELIRAVLSLNHLPEDADPWNWVISFKQIEI